MVALVTVKPGLWNVVWPELCRIANAQNFRLVVGIGGDVGVYIKERD